MLVEKRCSVGDETLKRCGLEVVVACDVFLAVVTNAGKGLKWRCCSGL